MTTWSYLFTQEIRDQAARSGRWWAHEPNPACAEWCNDFHDRDEFKINGVFVCSHTFPAAQYVRVELVRAEAAFDEVPGLVEADEPVVALFGSAEELTPDDARVVAAALVAAADLAEQAG